MGEAEDNTSQQQLKDHDAEKKQSAADYADKRWQASDKEMGTGDLVLLEKKKENKLSAPYESEPYKVTARYGDQVHIESQKGIRYKCNITHLKRFYQENKILFLFLKVKYLLRAHRMNSLVEPPPSEKPSTETETAVLRKPSRIMKPPEHFKDYIVTKTETIIWRCDMN